VIIMSKKCGHCKFSVPDDAIVCGYCGAEFVKYQDTSFFARTLGAVGCALFFYLISIFFTDSDSSIRTFVFWGGFIFGGLSGITKETTIR